MGHRAARSRKIATSAVPGLLVTALVLGVAAPTTHAAPSRGAGSAARTTRSRPSRPAVQRPERRTSAVSATALRREAPVRRVFDPRARATLPPSVTIAGNTYLSLQEYRDLRNGCMELLRRYPPDDYFFVGLGRDPAPVIAFLQNLGEKDLAVNLPGTSSIQWHQNRAVEDIDVARHIEAAIPEKILGGDRKLVILDVTSSGKTPAIFGPYLDRYLAKRGNPNKSIRLAFSWVNVLDRAHGPELTDLIDTHEFRDFENYYGGKYEGDWTPEGGGTGIAEHQRHEMGRGIRPPTETNPNYDEFRKFLAERMARDRELDAFIANVSKDAPTIEAPPPRTVGDRFGR
jgi:hypothetical protein